MAKAELAAGTPAVDRALEQDLLDLVV